ncbi:hypothetical protein BD769DRAFT_1668783 [Suillus cothurnatus]|nr:hypothetical protein BD769DRAFT_1668783 [Suillus cothurnatus]
MSSRNILSIISIPPETISLSFKFATWVVGTSLVILLQGSTWLHSAGSPNQDTQNMKAHLQVARNRAKKVQAQPPIEHDSLIEDHSWYLQEISSNMKSESYVYSLQLTNIIDRKPQMQPSAEQVWSDYEDLSDDFPHDAEQQSVTAVSPPPHLKIYLMRLMILSLPWTTTYHALVTLPHYKRLRPLSGNGGRNGNQRACGMRAYESELTDESTDNVGEGGLGKDSGGDGQKGPPSSGTA